MENGRLCDSYLGNFPERRTWKSARRTKEPKTDKAATGPREKKEARCARRVGDVALTAEDYLMRTYANSDYLEWLLKSDWAERHLMGSDDPAVYVGYEIVEEIYASPWSHYPRETDNWDMTIPF